MGQLGSVEKLEKIYLPSDKDKPLDEQDWVVLDVSPSTAADLLVIDAGDSSGETLIKSVFARLKEWSFTDASGQREPLTYSNFQRMDGDDVIYLNTVLKQKVAEPTGLTDGEKKASPAT